MAEAPTPVPTSQPTKEGKVAMRQCHDKVKAYGAAWLATRAHVLHTNYQETDHGEPASFYMFENGRALKTWDYRDMWVEHLSGLEAILRGTNTFEEPEGQALLQDSLQRAEDLCGGGQPVLGQEPPELSTVVILPFWSGFGAQQTPKFNSQLGLNGKLQQVKGTVCSTRRYFSRVVAGVCKNYPRDYADGKHDGEILREQGLPLHDIWEFDCPRGSSLIYMTINEAKARLGDGRLDAHYVYYTEMDQVLNIRGAGEPGVDSSQKLHNIFDWVQHGTYLAPNRLDVVYEPAFWRTFTTQEQIEENKAFEHMVMNGGRRYRQVRRALL